MTIIIIIVTALISVAAFNNRELMHKLNLNPYQVYHRKEWYRVISHGFIHADWNHLIMNMLVLYFFGPAVEYQLKQLALAGYISMPQVYFVLLYLIALVVASVNTIKKNKENPWYNAVGASGAVSAIVFTFIFFAPWTKLYVFFLIPIPGIIFGVLYLVYSYYMSKKSVGLINHEAHYYGAVFGLLFPLIIDFRLVFSFFDQLISF